MHWPWMKQNVGAEHVEVARRGDGRVILRLDHPKCWIEADMTPEYARKLARDLVDMAGKPEASTSMPAVERTTSRSEPTK